MCNVYRRFDNSEEALELAIQELLGYSVNITITENHIEFGYNEPVTYTVLLLHSVIYTFCLQYSDTVGGASGGDPACIH